VLWRRRTAVYRPSPHAARRPAISARAPGSRPAT